MDRYLNILEEKQPKPEGNIDDEKLRNIVSQISIQGFFGMPQAKYLYLAFSKDETSRMFNEYYKKLVSKYFGCKNITFLSKIAWKLPEIV